MVYNTTRWLDFAEKMREKRTLLSDWIILTLEDSMVVGLIHCYFTYTECGECGDHSMPPKRFWCGISQAEQVYIDKLCFFGKWWLGHHQMVSWFSWDFSCGSNWRIGNRTPWILAMPSVHAPLIQEISEPGIQDGAPQLCLLVHKPHEKYRYIISVINHSEMGVMFTNLANELGHHLSDLPHWWCPILS